MMKEVLFKRSKVVTKDQFNATHYFDLLFFKGQMMVPGEYQGTKETVPVKAYHLVVHHSMPLGSDFVSEEHDFGFVSSRVHEVDYIIAQVRSCTDIYEVMKLVNRVSVNFSWIARRDARRKVKQQTIKYLSFDTSPSRYVQDKQ